MKIERIYREILFRVLEEGKLSFTQKYLSLVCKLSLSTVNYALKPLRRMYAVEIKRRKFNVINPKKILVYWACIRNLKRDIVYRTFLPRSVEKIETSLPHNAILTAYSAFKLRFRKVPSDYSEVFVYGEKEDFFERFGKENLKQQPNLIVLKLDEHLAKFKSIPIAQIYVDLWNIEKWYANEFLKAIDSEINAILAKLGY